MDDPVHPFNSDIRNIHVLYSELSESDKGNRQEILFGFLRFIFFLLLFSHSRILEFIIPETLTEI